MHSKGNPKGKTKTTLRIGKILADKDTHNELVCNTHMNELEYTQTAHAASSKIQTTCLREGGEVLLKVFTFISGSKDLLTK